ncbi:hypothetical protein [Microvirga sp. Mcv34]|uniref:hypothetical protein n=1 Tax=Microvirga sp. Mcv34 TaxID=2926016 RepID=UPI0021C6763C|nr:hypothetical protein [Microvirga sp. Mcv34]
MNTTPKLSATPPNKWRALLVGTPLGWGLTLALAALGIYLFMNHSGHVVAALPTVAPVHACRP